MKSRNSRRLFDFLPANKMAAKIDHHLNNRRPRWLRWHRLRVLLYSTMLILFIFSVVGSRMLAPVGNSLRKSSQQQFLKVTKLPLTPSDLERINLQFAKMEADDILLWSAHNFPHSLIHVTSFGPSGLVILHKLQALGIPIPVVTIDTLHLFPESYQFIERLSREMNLNLHVYKPKDYDDREIFDSTFGSDLWKTHPDRYAYLSKVEPSQRALHELQATAWITGRRRSQGGERTFMDVIEVDNVKSTRIKINPLAYWTYEQLWTYIRQHNISYNPLHDRGYKSIGDTMTTDPVDDAAPERAGRFVGLDRTECGIHSTRKKIQAMREDAQAVGEDVEMGHLPCPLCVEIDPSNFDSLVLAGNHEMLIEFYSPLCGACQAFSPTFLRIAERLQSSLPEIQVGRFDITYHDVPELAKQNGMDISVTPTLFLVKHNPFEAIQYQGKQETTAVLNWLEEQTVSTK